MISWQTSEIVPVTKQLHTDTEAALFSNQITLRDSCARVTWKTTGQILATTSRTAVVEVQLEKQPKCLQVDCSRKWVARLRRLPSSRDTKGEQAERLRHEACLLLRSANMCRKVTHLCAVGPVEPYLNANYIDWSARLAFCVEEALCGSLEQFVHQHDKQEARLEGICQVMERVVVLLQQVHEYGFLHCDIKPDNILLNWDNCGSIDALSVRLADWECAIRENMGLFGPLGSTAFMSLSNERNIGPLCRADDWFSAAMTLDACLPGHRAWLLENHDDHVLRTAIKCKCALHLEFCGSRWWSPSAGRVSRVFRQLCNLSRAAPSCRPYSKRPSEAMSQLLGISSM